MSAKIYPTTEAVTGGKRQEKNSVASVTSAVGLDYNDAQPHFLKTLADKVKSQAARRYLRFNVLRFNYEVES